MASVSFHRVDLNLFHLSRPLFSCFDGDGAGVGAGEGTVAAAATEGAGAGTASGDGAATSGSAVAKLFTQEEVNKFLAEDRRKHQTRLEKMEKEYSALLQNEKLSSEEKAKLKESLDDVQKQLRTKDQQLAYEKQRLDEEYRSKLAASESKARYYENLHRESTIERALTDAAVAEDGYNPQQIGTILRNATKLVEEVDDKTRKGTGKFKVMVDLSAPNPETGAYEVTQMTPNEAVKRMKEMGEWRNLFKSNVVSGIGSNSATGGLTPGSGGTVDVRKLSPSQYQKLRRENPEALGLKPRRR